MLIKNFVRNEDGSCDFEYFLDPEEAASIMQHGLQDLISRGFIQVDTDQAQLELDLFKNEGGNPS